MRKTKIPSAPPSLVLHCGCEVRFRDGEVPLCPRHGAQRIVRTVRMPAPRIRGCATGPLVKTEDLGAWTGRLKGSESKP